MKRGLILVVLLAHTALTQAGYDYVIESGYVSSLPPLEDHDTLLVTGGGAFHIDLTWYSSAVIVNTSLPLQEHIAGIWEIGIMGHSHLDMRGGGVHEIAIGSDAQAVLSGGWIDQIWSAQSAYRPAGWPDPHITMICDVDSVVFDAATNRLTGNWLDGSAFDIRLIDVPGYDPVIENIQFIPEPTTLLLLGLGGVVLWRRRR